MDLTRLVADAILSAAADAVVATDRVGIIRVCNAGAVRIFGHHAYEALGQSLDLIIPERLRARHWEGFCHVMAIGASHYPHVGAGIRKDGRWSSPPCRSRLSHERQTERECAHDVMR
ncbi:PAS domain S-box protein [Microvirga sp. CF3062]|uniref:PAS domain S-box protein n=1 Tax=Microvirga sp. CF3062 TaxID=3110182 RepID=UPI003FA5722F